MTKLWLTLLFVCPCLAQTPDAPTPRKELAIELSASAFSIAADAYTTRQLLDTGRAYEGNPLARPFVHNGYSQAAIGTASLAMEYLLLRRLNRHPNWRFIISSGITCAEFGFAWSNQRVLSRVRGSIRQIP